MLMKSLGFGCMRLPMEPGAEWMNGKVDSEQFSRMVDTFLENGFTYFDTAHGYIGGKSETAIRECLVGRYPRDRYVLADKLTENFFQKEADIYPLFADQLSCMNAKKQYKDWNSDFYYMVHTDKGGKASDCIECGKCESSCPQHLRIKDLLKETVTVFERR